MSYPLKLLKTVWFGIKNNKVLLGFVGLLCVIVFPAFSVMFKPDGNIPGVFGCIAAYFCGFVTPVALLGYLHKGRECEFYNAMPVKKSQYFWGYFIAGLLIFLIPLTLMFAIEHAFGYDGWGEYYLKSAAAFLSIYCSTILAVVFSGSTASTVVTLIIRNGIAIALVALPLMIAAVDVSAYVELLFKPICILTPVTVGNAILDPQTTGVQGYQLIVAAIELVTAFLLHRYRKNETVTALAFPKSRYFYQYIVMLIFALGGDALLMPIFGVYDSDYGIFTTKDSFPLVVFLTLVIIFIAFILLNIVLEKNARAAFKKIRHFFIFSVGYAVLILSVSGICTNCIPPSVLPFRPDSAVVSVYSVTDVSDKDAEKWDFSYISFSDNSEDSWHYCKKILQEEFAVASPDKVKDLIHFAMNPSNDCSESSYLGILPKNCETPFERTGAFYGVNGQLPESFTLFTVMFKSTDPYDGGNRHITYRYGFASSPELIMSYKDHEIEKK